ncbi:MAG TPA: STAS domain-containing protein [Candidatus Binatia bacterium]|nr:STAS domain-containing protein [Candidatus Binatia bacterium]
MKIEKDSHGRAVTIRLSGDFQREHIAELKKQLEGCGLRMILDLNEVTLVDLDVVRFLAACKTSGTKIVRCPNYIREWISRECQSLREKEE